MWNPLSRVADTQFIDSTQFIAFAKQSPDKYGLDTKGVENDPWISNWRVDALLKDYREFIGEEEVTRQRNAAIAKIQEENRRRNS